MKKAYSFLMMLAMLICFSSNTSAYRLYVENNTTWETVSLYAWATDQPEYFGTWPGATAAGTETVDGVEYLYWETTETSFAYNLIFNNTTGTQLKDYPVTFNQDYYLTISDNGCTAQGETLTMHRIYVDDQSGWEKLCIYGWGEGNVQHFGAWPGKEAAGTETIEGVEYKYFEVAESTTPCNLIFNKGEGGEGNQFDGPTVTINQDFKFRITATECTVIEGTVEPTPDPNPDPTPATSFEGGFNIYLNPTDVWTPDGAWFALYVYGENGDAWATFADADADGYFETVVPEGTWNGLIYVRQDPKGTTPSWDLLWGQTYDLTYDGTNNLYTITGWGEDGKATGEWSVFQGGSVNPDPNPVDTWQGGFNIYLNPTETWTADSAWFALYVYNSNDNYNEWMTFSDPDADGIFETYLPDGTWTNLIFVRQDPAGTTPGWEILWGQTADLVYDGTNNLYTITGWGEDGKATGEWSVFQGGSVEPDPDPNPGNVYRLYIDDCSGWLTLNVYAWNSDNQELFGAWPGAAFAGYETVEGIELKYYEMKESEISYNIIFNDGAAQFDGPTITPNKDYYFKVTSDGYEELNLNSISEIETENAPVEYFNLQGVRVANPENGLYIRVQAGKVEKVVLK